VLVEDRAADSWRWAIRDVVSSLRQTQPAATPQ
jgi:hypothetical protein